MVRLFFIKQYRINKIIHLSISTIFSVFARFIGCKNTFTYLIRSEISLGDRSAAGSPAPSVFYFNDGFVPVMYQESNLYWL